MRATAIVPVKRFGAAKSRLADSPAAAMRPDLARAMLTDVLVGLRRSEELDAVIVVTGEPDAGRAARGSGAEWLDDPEDRGHSPAAMIGVAAALAAGAGCVALLPGDCPLLRAAELDQALAELEAGEVGVIADRHGTGTNGLLLAPPDAIEPSFGPGSCDRHLELAREAGVAARVLAVPSLALDLDTASDLLELSAVLQAEPDRAPATAAALVALGRDGPGRGAPR